MAQTLKSTRGEKKLEKKKIKLEKKRRKRINRKIERAVSFLAVLICIVSSVLEVKERKKNASAGKGDRV